MDMRKSQASAVVSRPSMLGANARRTKKRMNGWFMAIDPRTGMVLSVREMQTPENNQIAIDVLKDVVSLSPQIDGVVHDRMCSSLKKMSSAGCFKGVK